MVEEKADRKLIQRLREITCRNIRLCWAIYMSPWRLRQFCLWLSYNYMFSVELFVLFSVCAKVLISRSQNVLRCPFND
jgi:hypothetical protein